MSLTPAGPLLHDERVPCPSPDPESHPPAAVDTVDVVFVVYDGIHTLDLTGRRGV